MSTSQTTVRPFEFIGGQMCLDFVNTLGGLRGGVTQEYICSYDDLVAWSQQAGSMTQEQAADLRRVAELHPDEAGAVLESARMLREALYRIFVAVATDRVPAEADLAILNAELGKAICGGHIVAVADGFVWAWSGDRSALDQILAPIVRSAAELLISPERKLVRECASATCSWLFVDHTKNHRRRWCSMTGCGNVAKVRRHRQQQRTNSVSRSQTK